MLLRSIVSAMYTSQAMELYKTIRRRCGGIGKAVEQGQAESQHSLGHMYYQGEGVSQDYEEALRWFRKAEDQGYVQA